MYRRESFVVQKGNAFVAMILSGVLSRIALAADHLPGALPIVPPSVSTASSYTLGGSIATCLAEITYVEELKTTVYSEEV
jgi:hypothetical protein